jgi:ABC-type hemin transport system ATPase subunit
MKLNTNFVHRMTLLLGPPGSGKTTLLLALAGKLDSELKVEDLNDFLCKFEPINSTLMKIN